MGKDVIHGNIRELSLVLAGANPGAYVDFVMAHSEEENDSLEASWDENIMLYHSADEPKEKMDDNKNKESTSNENGEKTVKDVIDSMNEEQKTVMYAMIGQALDENGGSNDDDEGGNEVKHNVFDNDYTQPENVLSHSDEMAIISLAKQSNVGSLKQAMEIYAEENDDSLAHGIFEDTEALFPEY